MEKKIERPQIEAAALWHLNGAIRLTWDALFAGLGTYFAFVFITDAVGDSPLWHGLARIGLIFALLVLIVALLRIIYAGFLYFAAERR